MKEELCKCEDCGNMLPKDDMIPLIWGGTVRYFDSKMCIGRWDYKRLKRVATAAGKVS